MFEDYPIVDISDVEGVEETTPKKKKPQVPQKPKAPDIFVEMGKDLFKKRERDVENKRKVKQAQRKELELPPSFEIPSYDPFKGQFGQPPPPVLDPNYRTLKAIEGGLQREAEEKAFQKTLDERIKDKAKQKATAPSYPKQLISRFGRGYAQSGESMLKGISLLNPDAATDPTTKFLYQTPEEVRQRYQSLFPVNEYDESLAAKVVEGLGSSVPFIVGGIAAGPASPYVTAILGAASNAGSTYDDARANGADDTTARYAAIVGAVIGLTEAAGIGRLGAKGMRRLPFQMSPFAKAGQYFLETGGEGVEEWVQESVSRVLNNVNAKWVSGYDINRAIHESVVEDGITGFLTGMLAGGGAGLAGRLATYSDPAYQDLKRLDKELKRAWAIEENERSKGRFQTWLQETLGDRLDKWKESRQAKANLGGDPKTFFDLIPAEREGQAPVLVAPEWFFGAVTGIEDPSYVGGLNIHMKDVPQAYGDLRLSLGNTPEFLQARYAFDTLVDASREQGLTTVSLVSGGEIARGRGYHISHETFHSGQAAIGEWLRQRDPESRTLPFGGKLIHDSEWAKTHPAIRFLIDHNPSLVNEMRLDGVKISDEDLLATELPAYVNSGQWYQYFGDRQSADDFLADYLSHLRGLYGDEPLEILRVTSRMEQEVDDLVQRVLNEPYAGTSSTSRSDYQVNAPGLAPVGATGPVRGRDQVQDEGRYEGPSAALSRPPGYSDRQENLRRFLTGSETDKPWFHATTTDFDIFQRSRDLGFHFGTPRAANERIEKYGQAEETKYYEPEYDKPGSNVGAYWLNTGKAADVPDVFVNKQPVTTVENFLRRHILNTNPEINNLLKQAYSIYDRFKGMGFDRIDVAEMEDGGRGIVSDILLRELREVEEKLQDAAIRQFEAQGYNSLRYENEAEDEGSISYAILRSNQAKSVTGNIGTYDPTEKSTLLSVTGKPWYYFNFAKALDDPRLPPKMTVEQAEAMFKPGGRYSVKKDEWEWAIKPFIEAKREDGEKITRDELRQLAEDSLPRVEEVIKEPRRLPGKNAEQIFEEELDLLERNLNAAVNTRNDIASSIAALEDERRQQEAAITEGREVLEYSQLTLIRQLQERREALSRSENYVKQIESELENWEKNGRRIAETQAYEDKPGDDDTVPWSTIRAVPGGIPGTYRVALITLPNVPGRYISHAFDEPNIAVWVRFNEHQDRDGNRVLTIQEIQSDWHQQGRERGYGVAPVERNLGEHSDSRPWKVYNQTLGRYIFFATEANAKKYADSISAGIPDAPFKDTWHELAFKRMVRWAAENGINRVAWSTGVQQIRANTNTLRQQVDRMELKKYEKQNVKKATELLNELNKVQVKYINTQNEARAHNDLQLEEETAVLRGRRDYLLDLYSDRFGDPIFQGGFTRPYVVNVNAPIGLFIAYKNGQQRIAQNVNQEWLDKYLTKDIAQTLLNEGVAEGEDLTVGGKFHRQLYDTKLTWVAKEIGKKTGGRVEDVQVRTGSEEWMPSQNQDGTWSLISPVTGFSFAGPLPPDFDAWFESDAQDEGMKFGSSEEAEKYRDENIAVETVHSLTLTPQLSEKAQREGFALSTVPEPLVVGDKVRMRVLSGVSKEVGTILKIDRDEDGEYAIVQFKGAQEEIYLDRLVKDTPKVTAGLTEGLTGAGKAISENFRKALTESVEKTGQLSSAEKDSALWKEYESMVLGGAPRDATTLNAALLKVESTALPTTVAVIGDKVRVKGITDPVEVKYRATDGIIIQLPDGTRKTFNFNEIEEVVEKAPTRPPSTQPRKTVRQQVIADNPIISEANPDQPSLPGIEAPKRLVATPELPTSAQSQLPGMEEQPILFEEHITGDVRRAIMDGFKALLETGGVRRDPTQRIFLQVHDAVLTGKINPRKFANLLDENGLTIENFVTELESTASEAGRILGEYSRLSRYSVKFMKENPTLAKKVIPRKIMLDAILREIETSVLGRNVLDRLGGLGVGLILSDQFIAIRNAVTTIKRIPILGGTHAIGAWVKYVNEGSPKGMSYPDTIAEANHQALMAFEPMAEVLAHMTPPQLRRFLNFQGMGESAKYEEAITLLAKHFPHFEKELAVPGFAPEQKGKGSLQEMEKDVEIAREILEEMRIDVKGRDKLETRFKVAEKRLQSNIEGMGKVLRVAEWPLQWMMKPANLAEKFFRHPTFYGHLAMTMKQKGWDLADAIRFEKIPDSDITPEQKALRFRNIPEEDLKSSIDEALYFTHAYMPRAENGPLEAAGRKIIQTLNLLRPATGPALNLWFAKAMYNGFKFTWEYVPLIPLLGGVPFSLLAFPLGMVGPASRIVFPKTFQPIKGERVTENPIRPNDYKRFAAGIVGTIMYTLANSLIESGGGGDEWWQVDTGTTGKNGEPLFIDIRSDTPLANWMRVADLSRRVNEGRLNDIRFSKEMVELYTGMQRGTPEMAEALDAMVEMWSDGDEPKDNVSTNFGRRLSLLTKPFVNIRNLWAVFSEEENKRKDLKGTGFLGPLIDNLPYFRRSLPDLNPPTQKPPVLASEYPATQWFPGVKLVEGENFAGREWKRLGFFNRRFLQPDPNPVVNRAQNEYFRRAVAVLGRNLEKNAHYNSRDDTGKAAIWEYYISGDDGIAAEAREYGLEADPIYQLQEEMRRDSEQGPLQRKASGLEEKIKNIKAPPSR